MVKRMHYLSREHRNTFTNRMIGIGICDTWGRSLKNYTKDWSRVNCQKCLRRKSYVVSENKVTE